MLEPAGVANIGPKSHGPSKSEFGDREKEKDVRASNFAAARAVADAVRTSLGPKGMDKMVNLSSFFPYLFSIFLND